MAGTGDKIITASDFERRLSNLENSINSILAGIAFDLTVNYKNFMLESGVASVPIYSTDATITFHIPFAIAPRIVTGVNHSTQDFNVLVHTITTTGFKMTGFNRTTGANVDCHWIAFGKRG